MLFKLPQLKKNIKAFTHEMAACNDYFYGTSAADLVERNELENAQIVR